MPLVKLAQPFFDSKGKLFRRGEERLFSPGEVIPKGSFIHPEPEEDEDEAPAVKPKK